MDASTELKLQEMIKGMEEMGAEHVSTEDDFIYFSINPGSILNDKKKLIESGNAFKAETGLVLKVNYKL